jgi:hypothetical protein
MTTMRLAKKVLKLQTPVKLRLAAELLEQKNDVNRAVRIVRRALEELELIKALDLVAVRHSGIPRE